MRTALWLTLLSMTALGCAATPTPRAADWFPVTADGYWIFQGDDAGRPLRAGIRGAGVNPDGTPRLELAWQGGDVLRLSARRRDGFLELVADRYVLRVLPDDPATTARWEWDNNGVHWEGRVIRTTPVRVVPAGRFADVLEVELGPTASGVERWRWSFVVGIGPISLRAMVPGEGGATTLELIDREAGTRVRVPTAEAPPSGAADPATPVAPPTTG